MNDFGGAMFLIFAFFVFGFVIGSVSNNSIMQNSAIDAGVAKWTINEKTGHENFIYITNYSILTNK